MINLDEYDFFWLTCEGTNESEAINWIIEEGRFIIPKNLYITEFLRKLRSKCKREYFLDHEIVKYNIKKKVGIIYIHDSQNENWNVSMRYQEKMALKGIEVINVITRPEIEVLAIHSNSKWYSKWNKGTKSKPSDFLKPLVAFNIKQAGNFAKLFNNDFELFVESCKKYKSSVTTKNAITIYDLITK